MSTNHLQENNFRIQGRGDFLQAQANIYPQQSRLAYPRVEPVFDPALPQQHGYQYGGPPLESLLPNPYTQEQMRVIPVPPDYQQYNSIGGAAAYVPGLPAIGSYPPPTMPTIAPPSAAPQSNYGPPMGDMSSAAQIPMLQASPHAWQQQTPMLPAPSAPPPAQPAHDERFYALLEQQNKTMQMVAKGIEAMTESSSDKKREELQGVKHEVTSQATIAKLQFSAGGGTARNFSNWQTFSWKFNMYIVQRCPRYGESILERMKTWCESAVAKYEQETNARKKAEIAIDVNAFMNEFDSRAEKEAYKSLSSESLSLFPQHVQHYCIERQKAGHRHYPHLVDLLFIVYRDMVPRDCIQTDDIKDQFLTIEKMPNAQNASGWLISWKTTYDLLKDDGYFSRDENHVKLYRVLRKAQDALEGNNTRLTMRMENWSTQHPLPTKWMSADWFFDYYWELRGHVEKLFPGTSGEVHLIDYNKKKEKKDKGDGSELPKQPGKGGGTPDPDAEAHNVDKTKAKGKDKNQRQESPKKGVKDLTPAQQKKYYEDMKAKAKEKGIDNLVCVVHFMHGSCSCHNILSHALKDWEEFCVKVKDVPCRHDKGEKRACKYNLKNPPNGLKACPYKHHKEAHYLAADDCDDYEHETHAIDSDTVLLFDRCASTGVASTFPLDKVTGQETIRTVNGEKTATSGIVTIAGNDMEFVSTGQSSRNILNATEFLARPEILGFTDLSQHVKVHVGGPAVYVQNAGRTETIPLGTNERGFPTITVAQLEQIEHFANANNVTHDQKVANTDEVHTVIVAGMFNKWETLPERSQRMLLKAISSRDVLRSKPPSHYYTNTSGTLPPQGGDWSGMLDLECDKDLHVLMITDVTNNPAKEGSPNGPAHVVPWRNRVIRVVYDYVPEEPVVPVAAISTSKGRVTFEESGLLSSRQRSVEAHLVDNMSEQFCMFTDIAADKLAVSLITDIAADNDGRFAAEVHPVETRAQAAAGQESDTWEELDDKWVIHHRVPRSAFFVPTPGLQSGPNPDELDSARETTVVYASMPTYETHQFVPESGVPIENGFVLRDNWRQSKARVLRDRWTGKTIFFKTLLVAALADKTVVGATADSVSEHQSVLPSALSTFESPSVVGSSGPAAVHSETTAESVHPFHGAGRAVVESTSIHPDILHQGPLQNVSCCFGRSCKEPFLKCEIESCTHYVCSEHGMMSQAGLWVCNHPHPDAHGDREGATSSANDKADTKETPDRNAASHDKRDDGEQSASKNASSSVSRSKVEPAEKKTVSDTRKAVKFRNKRHLRKFISDLEENLRKRFPKCDHKELSHKIVNHSPSCPSSCVICALGNQRREPHPHSADLEKINKDRWHLDTMGPIEPVGYDGSRYVICGIDELDDRLFGVPVRTKHSKCVANAQHECRGQCGRWPKAIRTGNDTEYKGECEQVYKDHDIDRECAPRYSPWRNGHAEASVHTIELRATPALIDSNLPYSAWPLAVQHAVETENILHGIEPNKTSVSSADANDGPVYPLEKMGPLGCICSVVREQGEETGAKLGPRSWLGFHAGYVFPDLVRVGYMDGNKIKTIVSQNVKVFPEYKFFRANQNGPGAFLRLATPHVEQVNNTIDWVKTTCCSKWRELTGYDVEVAKELPEVTCEDVGTNCSVPQDARASSMEIMNCEIPFQEEVYQFEACSKKVAMSDSEWFNSGRTYKDVMQDAIEKELATFMEKKSIDFSKPEKRSSFRKRCPEGQICLMNMLTGTKNVEKFYGKPLEERNAEGLRAKGRWVVFKELRASDLKPTSGFEQDEVHFSHNPSFPAIRAFDTIMTGAEKQIDVADAEAAYQGAPALDKVPTVAQIDDKRIWPKEWHNQFDERDPPVVPIVGSLYGRKRAGDDYNRYADESLHELGWSGLRDIEPAIYIKPSSNDQIPDGLCRYTDDFKVGASKKTIGNHFEDLKKKFTINDIEPLNGQKYVGVVTEIEEVKGEKGLYRITWQQKDLIRKYVDEFLDLGKERGYKVKKRKLPAPSSDHHTPKSREEDERQAAVSAEQHKNINKGKLSDVALHFINAAAFAERCTRPDISEAIQRLQTMTNDWTEEGDHLLIWLFGYLDNTWDRVLTGYIHADDLRSGSLYQLIQSDGSHASERDTRRGVGGYAIFLKGPRTSVLLAWGTKMIPVVTLSSMETEIVSAVNATKHGIHMKLVLDALLGTLMTKANAGVYDDINEGMQSILEMDAEAAIKAIKNSSSTRVRHVRRTMGISIYFLHEQWCTTKNAFVRHKKGTELVADLFTKSLSIDPFSKHCDTMGLRDHHDHPRRSS